MKQIFWFVNAVIVASTAFYVYNVALRKAKITGEYNSAGIEKKHESSHTKNNDAPAQEVEDVTDMETAEKLLKTRSPHSSFPITFKEAKEIIESKAAMKGLPDNKKNHAVQMLNELSRHMPLSKAFKIVAMKYGLMTLKELKEFSDKKGERN